MPEIEVKNLGPIEEFRYEMSEPGLHLLLGQQGSGKSTTLRTVELAVQGETSMKPTKRDGAKTGEATIAGKTLKINRVTREEGELSVEGLADLDITTLHWPKFEKPAIRDKTRIATLCRLSGLKGSVDDFKEIVGEDEWNTLVGPKVTITDDVVELASRIKRALDAAALDVEKQASISEANAVAQVAQFEDVDVSQPHDEQALATGYAQAVGEQQRLQGEAASAASAANSVSQAQSALASMPAIDLGSVRFEAAKDVVDAEQASESAYKASVDAVSEVNRLKDALEVATKTATELHKAEHDARERLKLVRVSSAEQVRAAEQAVEDRRRLEATIASVCAAAPSDERLAAANAEAEAAHFRMMAGQTVRVALAAKVEHEKHVANAKSMRKRANKLREAAQSALSVLGDAIAKIPNCPLKVIVNTDGDTRLVIASDRSDEEYFDELSDGERWKVIVPLTLNPGRLIVLPQAAFGEMAPSTAAMLDGLIREQLAYVLTARAEDVPLQGMSYRDWSAAKV